MDSGKGENLKNSRLKDTMLQTPEGVRDIYGSECERKMHVLKDIHHVMHLYGSQDIETPTFEYFNIFNSSTGSAPSDEMFKFFDRNNNTLVLRPDITPSVARSVAKYYPEVTLPIRLCYEGHTYLNTPQHQGKLDEVTQIGSELINDDSSAADADMISCMIDCLRSAGLEKFQVEIGEVDYFKGLVEEGGLSPEEEEKIRDLIQIRNFFGLSEYVKELHAPSSVIEAFDHFDTLFGGPDMLERAEAYAGNERSREAIRRMKKVYRALDFYDAADYVSFDLSMINGYDYYTGIVFSGFTYGTGNPVARGGRYNTLLSRFGKEAPSIGFAIQVDEVMKALSRQKIPFLDPAEKAVVLYPAPAQQHAVALAKILRNKNVQTQLIRQSRQHDIKEYLDTVRNFGADRLFSLTPDHDVKILDREGKVLENTTVTKLKIRLQEQEAR